MEHDVDFEELMKELGWTDGFHMPFANDENKALEAEVKKMQKERENLKIAFEEAVDKLTVMQKHIANVQKEEADNQSLLFAHHSQIKAEENLLKLAQGEEGGLVHDIRDVKKELADVMDRQDILQCDLNKAHVRIEKMKAIVNWDKEALLAWDEEIARGDQDTMILEKFAKEDQQKFKDLELKRQTVRMEVEGKRHKLERCKNDVLCLEQGLEKTAQMYRRQHKDRQALIHQWEASVKILHQRDEDINKTMEEIGALRALGKEKMKDLKEQKAFYDNEVLNNKEVEKQTEATNKEVALVREEVKKMEGHIEEINSNLLALKGIVSGATRQVKNQRQRNKEMAQEIIDKMAETEAAQLKVESLKEELSLVKTQSMSANERVMALENICKAEERAVEKIQEDCRKLGELSFQVTEQMRLLKNKEIEQVSNMSNIEVGEVALKKEIVKLQTEMIRQREILYHMDYSYMEQDIKMNRMLGSVQEDEREKYEKKVKELEIIQKKVMSTHQLLTKEVTRLEDEMRRLTTDIFSDSRELDVLKNRRQDNVLLTEGGQKQLKTLRTKNQHQQVDENVLKLRVKQAEKIIDRVGGNVFSLEKQRLELQGAMKERDIEIKALRDVMTVRRRVLHDQVANLNGRINLGRVKVDQLWKKYEVSIGKLGTDEDGQQLSVTYFKIKIAQEKYELQLIGDKLDAKVKKTEKEILAMENTLKVVNVTNKNFRTNLQQIDPDSPEQCEKVKLDMMYGEVLECLRGKRAVLEQLNEKTAKMEIKYQEQLVLEDNILTAWKEKDQQATELDKDLREQEDKLCRAERQLKRLIRDIRGTQATKFQTIEEKDIELRELMEQNTAAMQQLAEMVAKYVEVTPTVCKYMCEHSLTLPSVRSPSSSIKYGSSSSLLSTGLPLSSSKSSEVPSSRTSSCAMTPSVVSLDPGLFGEHYGAAESMSSKSSSKKALGPSRSSSIISQKEEKKSSTEVVEVKFDDKSVKKKHLKKCVTKKPK